MNAKKELIKVLPYNQVKFRWISNHYDVHLKGTCMYNGELCEFENEIPHYNEETNEWEEMFVNIYKLDFISKFKWIWKQWLFEKCVGYHWSHNDKRSNKGFYYRKPKWLYMWMFNCYYRM